MSELQSFIDFIVQQPDHEKLSLINDIVELNFPLNTDEPLETILDS